MRILLAAYKKHLVPDFPVLLGGGYFFLLSFFLGMIVYVNYGFGFPKFSSPLYSLASDAGLYTVSFAGAYLLQGLFYKDNRFLFQKPFLLLSMLAPAIFACRLHWPFLRYTQGDLPGSAQFIYVSFNYLSKATFIIVLLVLVWQFKDRKQIPLYGFPKIHSTNIYILLLLLMLPFLLVAANHNSFTGVYPKAVFEAGLRSNSGVLNYLFFELCYGFDFVSIEFFFRGFLILAFVKYAGIRAILPAACFYCCIHLGKPMPEAICSFFGGLLLGIISYYTKSIWGGLIMHLGIAWMMEWLTWCLYHGS